MPLFPQVDAQYTQKITTDTFGGYNHILKVPDGEWYDTKNLTTDFAPMLANRKPRGNLNVGAVSLAEKKSLAYVGTNGTLYFNFSATGLTGLSQGEKQMVSMGAYLVIFPDKKYINTENLSEYGDLEATFEPQSATYSMCLYDGNGFTADYKQATEPTSPQSQQYWIDTSSETFVLKQWSETTEQWVTIETVFIKITFTSLGTVPALFKENDGVTISGATIDINGEKVICACGGRAADIQNDDPGEADWIMVTGMSTWFPSDPDTSVVITRKCPNMDYVCECQNRLWGCYYGHSNGETINEIYCSALGDFKNWRQYQGLATDSWAATVGSDGQWTGAVNYLGHPIFFKENRIHRVTVSSVGAHQVDELVCRGVQKGSSKSLVVVNETLYYKAPDGVCAWQGGFPSGVSAAFGNEQYRSAVAGAIGSKYYISMLDDTAADYTQSTAPANPADGKFWIDTSGAAYILKQWDAAKNQWTSIRTVSFLFVYDIAKGIWLHEDDLRATAFARVDNELFAVAGNNLITMRGSLCGVAGATAETGLTWEAVSGVQYYEVVDNKRLSRYYIRMKMAHGASLSVYLQYDSNGTWVSAGSFTASAAAIDSMLFPIRPRRCDHLQIKLVGSGDIRIFSIAKILEVGSDYR